MQHTQREFLVQEKPSVRDIFRRRPISFRLYETLSYMLFIYALAFLLPMDSMSFQALAIVAGAFVLFGSSYVYRWVLQLEYRLSGSGLHVIMRGKERIVPYNEIERVSMWRTVFRLSGRKETLMASDKFVDQLMDRIEKAKSGNRKQKKKR